MTDSLTDILESRDASPSKNHFLVYQWEINLFHIKSLLPVIGQEASRPMILRDPLCLSFAMFGFMHVFDERLILLYPPPTPHHHPHRKKGHIRIISWYRITPELNVCTFALVDTWSEKKVPSAWIGFWIVNRAEQWKENPSTSDRIE